MKMSIKKRLKKIFYCILSVALVCSGLFCAAVRISNSGIDASFDIIAAQTAMPTGTAQYSEPPEISETKSFPTIPGPLTTTLQRIPTHTNSSSPRWETTSVRTSSTP